MILETSSPKSRFWQIWFLWELSSWLEDWWLLSHDVLIWPFLDVCMWRGKRSFYFFFYKVTSRMGLGPHPMISFNLNYLLRMLSSNKVKLGFRTSTYGFLGDTIHSIALLYGIAITLNDIILCMWGRYI